MRSIALVALLTLSATALAQITPDQTRTGTIVREPVGEETIDNPPEITQLREATRKPRPVEISYDPADLGDTSWLDSYEVFTWTDAQGVRNFTDDPHKAPRNARTRKIYSVPSPKAEEDIEVRWID